MLLRYTIFLIIISLAGFANTLPAQKTKHTSGSATVLVEEWMSDMEAKNRARELAIVNAIDNAFGAYVVQESNLNVYEGVTDFRVYAGIRVKGDWIETSGTPVYKESIATRRDGEPFSRRSWTCTIKGVARELTATPFINYKVLNCPQEVCERTRFKSKDRLFVYLKSPIDGYAAVFIEEGDVTRRLLPYRKDTLSHCIQVKENQQYFFFDEHSDQPFVEGIELYTDLTGRDEVNIIHLIFSDQPFNKPALNPSKVRQDGLISPSFLPNEDFSRWLEHNRSRILGFQDIPVRITISPNK